MLDHIRVIMSKGLREKEPMTQLLLVTFGIGFSLLSAFLLGTQVAPY